MTSLAAGDRNTAETAGCAYNEEADRSEISHVTHLYREYQPRLRSMAQALTKCPYLAEDVVHEVFRRAFEQPQRVPAGESGLAYLMRSIRNEVLHVRDRESRWRHCRAVLDGEPLRSPARTPSDELRRRVLTEALRDAVDSLPHQQRQAFVLTRIRGLTYAQAAREMGRTVKTIEMHVRLATKALRRSSVLLQVARM